MRIEPEYTVYIRKKDGSKHKILENVNREHALEEVARMTGYGLSTVKARFRKIPGIKVKNLWNKRIITLEEVV